MYIKYIFILTIDIKQETLLACITILKLTELKLK